MAHIKLNVYSEKRKEIYVILLVQNQFKLSVKTKSHIFMYHPYFNIRNQHK